MKAFNARKFSLIWLVPLVALLVAVGMLAHSRLAAGPVITVSFPTAEGLEVGKTQVRYRNVVIGQVASIDLTDDRSHVETRIALQASAEPFTARDTRFWVVRPSIGAQGVTGVSTLLSGAYINVDAGRDSERSNVFSGLASRPPVTLAEPGSLYTLHSASRGSLDVGSQVYYRRIPVGQVVAYRLTPDNKSVDIDVFIKAPNDRFVTADSRFWDTSGLDIALGSGGLRTHAGTLAEIVSGGIEFVAIEGSNLTTPAANNSGFTLFRDRQSAMAPDDGTPRYVTMAFDQPLRGLSEDAPVEFHGMNMGKVVSVKLDYDSGSEHFPTLVGAVIYPSRLGKAHERLLTRQGGESEAQAAQLVAEFVMRGFRAQARTGSLLTGQLYIALDFDPGAAPVHFDIKARPLRIPTIPGRLDKIEEQLNQVASTFSHLPLAQISANLDGAVSELSKTLNTVNGQTLPLLKQTASDGQRTLATVNDSLAEDSPLRRQARRTVLELQQAATSIRAVTALLSGTPQSVLQGRQVTPPPAPYAAP